MTRAAQLASTSPRPFDLVQDVKAIIVPTRRNGPRGHLGSSSPLRTAAVAGLGGGREAVCLLQQNEGIADL